MSIFSEQKHIVWTWGFSCIFHCRSIQNDIHFPYGCSARKHGCTRVRAIRLDIACEQRIVLPVVQSVQSEWTGEAFRFDWGELNWPNGVNIWGALVFSQSQLHACITAERSSTLARYGWWCAKVKVALGAPAMSAFGEEKSTFSD